MQMTVSREQELAVRYFDGTADELEVFELESFLVRDARFADWFGWLARLEVALAGSFSNGGREDLDLPLISPFDLTQPPCPVASAPLWNRVGQTPTRTGYVRRGVAWLTHSRIGRSMLSVAAICSIGILWNSLRRDARQDASNLELGFVVASGDAVWHKQPQSVAVATGAANRLGITRGEPLELLSGLVELELKRGVRLVVEGPAAWTLDDNNRTTLTRGKLAARVPEQAVGFTVVTPTAEVVDLGTEFGVEVRADGVTEAQVTRGVVKLQGRGNTPAQPRSHTLTADQAAQVDLRGDVARVTFVPNRFVRQLPGLNSDSATALTGDVPARIPGLCLWLRADRGVSLDERNGVERWADGSGRSHDALQAAAASRPVLKNSQIQFDGVDDSLLCESSLGIRGRQDSLIALLAAVPVQCTNLAGIFSLRSHEQRDWDSPDGLALLQSTKPFVTGIAVNYGWRAGKKLGATSLNLRAPLQPDRLTLIVLARVEGIATLQVDNDPPQVGMFATARDASANRSPDLDNGYCLGARAYCGTGPGISMFGQLCLVEVLAFDRVLSASNRDLLLSYLRQRQQIGGCH